MTSVATPAPTPTPEFLIWAIELRCHLRDIEGFEQPERTDRQLRAVRAVSDARHERREFEGLCIARSAGELAIPSHAASGVEAASPASTRQSLPQAVRVTDALQLFGDASTIEHACRDCPANAEQRVDPQSWAGCYGIVPLPQDAPAFHAAIHSAIDHRQASDILSQSFRATQPAWYGLWLRTKVDPASAKVLTPIIQAAAASLEMATRPIDTSALRAFARGLTVTATTDLPMNVSLYPRGSVIGRWWQLEPSCPNCRATLSEPATHCPVCTWSGRQGTPPKRRSRGTRPYRPFSDIVGPAEAEALLERYQSVPTTN
jgi:hypothetical protein